MIIQQIPLGDGHNLYLLGYNQTTGVLTFRTSRVPEHRQEETIKQVGEFIHTNLYKFHVSFLLKLIENE